MIDSDSESHPKIDILRLLAIQPHDPYRLCKELGIRVRDCYHHLKALDNLGLIKGRFRYYTTEKGREILSRIEGLK